MRFFLKHPRFWGDLFIAAAVIGSNAGSAWAGMVYEAIREIPPFETGFPPDSGFQLMGFTVYPLAIALLVLGVCLRSKYQRKR